MAILMGTIWLALASGCKRESNYGHYEEDTTLQFIAFRIHDSNFARAYRAASIGSFTDANDKSLARELVHSGLVTASIAPFVLDEQRGILDKDGHRLGVEIHAVGTGSEALISIWTIGANGIDEEGLGDDRGWMLFDGKILRITTHNAVKSKGSE